MSFQTIWQQATDCDDRAHIGPAHVDNKIVQEVFRAATGDTLMHAPQLVQKWCTLKVQSPHHEGGYAITPTAASGLAAFYSAFRRSARAFPPTSFYARRRGTRMRAIQAQISQLDPPRVSQLFRAHHGILHVQSIQQGEGDSGLDFLELSTAGTAIPALAPVQGPRMHVRPLCY